MASPDADVEAAACALIASLQEPRRRARPRLAPALVEGRELEIALPEGDLAAWRLGEGPATLFVHGWEDDNALWGPFLDLLARYGRASAALDLPGHGYSAAPFRGIDGAVEALLRLEAESGPFDSVVGHSFGCVLSIAALSRGLRASSAVLIAPPIPTSTLRRVERRLAEVPEGALKDRARARLAAAPASDPPIDIKTMVQGLSARALFIHALDDPECPPENSRSLAALWPGAALRLVDGLGHRGVAQDTEVIAAAFAFLEGLSPDSDFFL